MRIINCSEGNIVEGLEYRHFDTAVPFYLIPARLADRMEIKMVDEDWFMNQIKGWGAELRRDLNNVEEITGLDKFYWSEGENYFTLSFKPLVGLGTVMGEGFIESLDQNIEVTNSPVVDFDYQDAYFETGLEKIQAIIRTINH